MKIEHLGIAVKSLETSDHLFARLLGKENYKKESVEREGVTTSFYELGDSKIELLEATNPDSPIAKFIDKKGEGIHHIAFNVDDTDKVVEQLEESFEGVVEQQGYYADGSGRYTYLSLHKLLKCRIELLESFNK